MLAPQQIDELIRGMVHEDRVLPVQLLPYHKQRPELDLMFAVLQDAIGVYLRYRDATRVRQRRLSEDARQWVVSDDEQWPFSFMNICWALKLDPGSLRRGIFTPTTQPLNRIKLRALHPNTPNMKIRTHAFGTYTQGGGYAGNGRVG